METGIQLLFGRGQHDGRPAISKNEGKKKEKAGLNNNSAFSVDDEIDIESADWYNNRANRTGDLINEFYPALDKSEWKKVL